MFNIKLMLIDDENFSECERFYEDYMAFATRENVLEYQASNRKLYFFKSRPIFSNAKENNIS